MKRQQRRASIKVDPKKLCSVCRSEVGIGPKPCKIMSCSAHLCEDCAVEGGWQGYCLECRESSEPSEHQTLFVKAPLSPLQMIFPQVFGQLQFDPSVAETKRKEEDKENKENDDIVDNDDSNKVDDDDVDNDIVKEDVNDAFVSTAIFPEEVKPMLFEKFFGSAGRAMNAKLGTRFEIPAIDKSFLEKYFNFVLLDRASHQDDDEETRKMRIIAADFVLPEMAAWTNTHKSNLYRKLMSVIDEYKRKIVFITYIIFIIYLIHFSIL